VDGINLTDLLSKEPKVKYGCAKKLITVAREEPSRIYPDLSFFVELLDSENRIIRWTAIDIIGALARVDTAKKIDKLIERLFRLLNTGNMITANHAISALTDIALAKPEYIPEITSEMLKVEHYNYDTVECRNISIGKVILAIGTYFDKLADKKETIDFVRRHTKNARNATRKKAEQFLKKQALQN
jgi:hypothetical protein